MNHKRFMKRVLLERLLTLCSLLPLPSVVSNPLRVHDITEIESWILVLLLFDWRSVSFIQRYRNNSLCFDELVHHWIWMPLPHLCLWLQLNCGLSVSPQKHVRSFPHSKSSHVQGLLISAKLLISANVSLIASKSEVGAVVFTIRFVDVISHV
jgi:hypothetical protein